MNKNNISKKITIPVSSMVDQAARDLDTYIQSYEEQKGITDEFMVYALQSSLLKIMQKRVENLSINVIGLQTHIAMIHEKNQEEKQEE